MPKPPRKSLVFDVVVVGLLYLSVVSANDETTVPPSTISQFGNLSLPVLPPASGSGSIPTIPTFNLTNFLASISTLAPLPTLPPFTIPTFNMSSFTLPPMPNFTMPTFGTLPPMPNFTMPPFGTFPPMPTIPTGNLSLPTLPPLPKFAPLPTFAPLADLANSHVVEPAHGTVPPAGATTTAPVAGNFTLPTMAAGPLLGNFTFGTIPPLGNFTFGTIPPLGNFTFGPLPTFAPLGNFTMPTFAPLGNLTFGTMPPFGNFTFGTIPPLGNFTFGTIPPLGNFTFGTIPPLGNFTFAPMSPLGNFTLGTIPPLGNFTFGTIPPLGNFTFAPMPTFAPLGNFTLLPALNTTATTAHGVPGATTAKPGGSIPCGTSTCTSTQACAAPFNSSQVCVNRMPEKTYCVDNPCPTGMKCFDNITSNAYTCYTKLDGSTGECLGVKCSPGDICYQVEKQAAKCISLVQAPKCLGQNEEFSACKSGCESTCLVPTPACMNSTTCTPGCACIRGYVRHNGQCQLMTACESTTTGNITCSGAEEYTMCKPHCEKTCNGIPTEGCMTSTTTPAPTSCTPGCACREAYKRDSNTGQCVHARQCYSATKCGANEIWSKCRNCEPVCGQTKNPSCKSCWSGCACISGYSRNQWGSCVMTDQCIV